MYPRKCKKKLYESVAQEQQSKKPKTQPAELPGVSSSKKYVKTLKETKNTPENRSFHDLDYNLMTELFKGRGRALLEAAKALRDSPPAVSDFDFSENPSQCMENLEQLGTTTPLSSKYNNIDRVSVNVTTPTQQELTANSYEHGDWLLKTTVVSPKHITPPAQLMTSEQDNKENEVMSTFCSESPSILSQSQFAAAFSMDEHSIRLNDDDLTDCESPFKASQLISRCPTEIEVPSYKGSETLPSVKDTITVKNSSLVKQATSHTIDKNCDNVTLLPISPETTSENNIITAGLVIASNSKSDSQALSNNAKSDKIEMPTGQSNESVPNTSGILSSLLVKESIQDEALPFDTSQTREEIMSSESDIEIDDSDADPDYPIGTENGSGKTDTESDGSLSSITDKEDIIKTRKTKADPSNWKRNKTKNLRNAGKEYRTLKKGNLVSSRKMGSPCNDSCRFKCSTNFTKEEREDCFEKYWALEDINKQRQFILSTMETIKPAYRYPVHRENQSNRHLNNAFYCYKGLHKERVCKKFFVSTLGITNRSIRTVISKTKDGFLSDDMRGKHNHHARVPEELKSGARAHIASIPTVESHYTRADTSKNYIEGGRTLIDLYRDYKQDCQNVEKDVVSFSIYREIFNYEFNLEFFKPKKDLCQFCETYKNMNNDEKLDKEVEYMRHHEEKNLSRDEKALDKSKINKNYKVACFDLQAALPTPKGEVSTFYYKSKLSTYDFTICDLNNKGLGPVNCYVWHEGEGHKGSTEIGSCILNYLELCAPSQNIASTSQASEDDVEVVFYSDNCGGQGKNKFIIAAYLYAVANWKIKAITHKFLVVGHTQNEGDVAHSLIEKNIKKALKSGPIYVPSQYVTLISTARKSGAPFKVHELDHDFFLDLKDLVNETATNFNVNSEGEKFNFNDICVVKVEKEHPGTFFYKTSFKDNAFKSVNVTRCRTRKQLALFTEVQPKKAYDDSISISQRKYQDLMSLLKSKVIPHCYSAFYESLKHD